MDGYAGVCLTYSSTNIVRMDFMQMDIWKDENDKASTGDNNFYGLDLPSTNGSVVSKFVLLDTSVVKMGWTGETKWKLNKKQQIGLQFSYKGKYVKKHGAQSDISITAVSIADACPTHAPEVKSTFKTEYTIREGEHLTLRMSDIFTDIDGDSLTISGKGVGTGVVRSYDDTQVLTLADSIDFTTVMNPADTSVLKFTLTATDPTNKKASCTITITPVDVKNAPILKDTTFSVWQGDTIKPLRSTNYFYGDSAFDQSRLAYDLDGDPFRVYLDTTRLPAFGEFSFKESNGTFTYIAPADTSGDVFFYLYAMEIDDTTSISDTVEFKITVKDINDPPEVVIKDSVYQFYTGDLDGAGDMNLFCDSTLYIEMDEDFEDTIWVAIDTSRIVFSDVDSELKMGVKSSGVVNAKLVTIALAQYIEITSKKNANGFAKVTYYADDGEFQVGVDVYVKVKPIEDLPFAGADSYEAEQGKKLSVNAKDGVLKNDENIDDPNMDLTAEVADKPKHGTLNLKEDGSFTYKSDEDFSGDDSFTYICINEDGVKSKAAKVTIKVAAGNKAPVVVEGIADSLEKEFAKFEEDKVLTSKVVKFTDMNTWFEDPDGHPMTFDAKNEDGKLKVEVTEKSIKIVTATDSCGESEIIFIATDSLGASTELVVPVYIKPVNDKPVAVAPEDARYNVELKDWKMEIDLDSLVSDADGDTLDYVISSSTKRLLEKFKMEIDGHVLKISPQKVGLDPGTDYLITIVCSDKDYSVNLVLTFHSSGKADALRGIAQPLTPTWQNAVQASRGVVAIMDLQGRVMWSAKLPVNEADVRNASAKVQGRKVLRVNSQTWTIK